MSAAQPPKTPDEWRKDQEAAEAQAAALDARRKLVEARTALAAAEAAGKAAADARKAASEAGLAAFKTALGEVPASGYTGSVALPYDAGRVEAALLAALAVRTAADRIRTVVSGSNRGAKTIIVSTAADLPKLDALTAFDVQAGLARTALAKAAELSGQVMGAGDAIAPITAAAGLTLDAVNKLVGYFRTDYEIGGFDVPLEDSLLVSAIAGALTNDGWSVHIPARYDAGKTAAVQVIVETLGSLSQANARGRDLQQEHERTVASLIEEASTEADSGRKDALKALARRHQHAADTWQGAITIHESMFGKLTQADDQGTAPLSRVVRERSLVTALQGGAKLLVVALHKTGGAHYSKKNLWSWFGGMPFYHMGGTVAEFALFDGQSGAVVAADVIPVHGGFVKAGDLQATVRQGTRAAPG